MINSTVPSKARHRDQLYSFSPNHSSNELPLLLPVPSPKMTSPQVPRKTSISLTGFVSEIRSTVVVVNLEKASPHHRSSHLAYRVLDPASRHFAERQLTGHTRSQVGLPSLVLRSVHQWPSLMPAVLLTLQQVEYS